MSPKFSVLLVLIILERAGSSVRPVVTFKPNWDKIFTKESLTMTCNVRSPIPADMSYTWYKDNYQIYTGQSFVIEGATTYNSGNYQCKGTNTDISGPVRLDISNGWVILQAPLNVHEGDDVTLRCHHYPGYDGGQSIFYKDNVIKRNWESVSTWHINNINVRESGEYKCEKQVYHHSWNYRESGGTSISIKELFTTPKIKVTPFPVKEGDNMTATCYTNVSLYRPETELQFAFYKDGRNVQRFGSSDRYGFQSAKPENSGKYYCEVSDKSIRKKSKELNIEINAFFTHPKIIMTPNEMTEGDNMALTCHTERSELIPDTSLEFAFYRDGKNVQEFSLSNRYEVQSAEPNHSGIYSCEVRSSTNDLTKSSEELYIQIQELFSHPEIEMIPDVVKEGNQMILTCNTSIMSNDVELQFAFYKNGQNIQEFSSFHQYEVPSAQLGDSGNYYCEVTTSTNNVNKKSKELNVDIQGNSSTELLTILLPLALGMLLILAAILVTLFICSKRSFVKIQEPTTEEPTSSSDFNGDVQPEVAYSVLARFPMSQNAPETTKENHENNVVYAAVKHRSRRQPATDLDSIYQNI